MTINTRAYPNLTDCERITRNPATSDHIADIANRTAALLRGYRLSLDTGFISSHGMGSREWYETRLPELRAELVALTKKDAA